MLLDSLVNESAALVFKICHIFNLLKMQATAREKKTHNIAMKMVPKVNSRFPEAKLCPY